MLKITFTQPEPSHPAFIQAQQDAFLNKGFQSSALKTLHRHEKEPVKYSMYNTALPFDQWKLGGQDKQIYVLVHNPLDKMIEGSFRMMHDNGKTVTLAKYDHEEFDALEIDSKVQQLKARMDIDSARHQVHITQCAHFAGRLGLSMQIEVFDRIDAADFDNTSLSIDRHAMQMTLSKN